MNCSVACRYVSVGCSVGPYRVDWGKNYIAFCLLRNIYLVQPQNDHVPARTLNSGAVHADNVTCLRWMISDSEGTDYLLSSALNGDVFVWSVVNGRLEQAATLGQTEGYVSAIAGVWIQDMKSSFVVGCSNRSLQFWKDFLPIRCIEFDNDPPICCDICAINAGILAVSGHTDFVCRVHFIQYDNEKCTSIALAESCQDWLCSVRFSPIDSSFYLAGGSRDSIIRIWKIHQNWQPCQEDSKFVTKKVALYETANETCAISLETVIRGHTEAITSICWNPTNKYHLLSSSMDKSIIFWLYNEATDQWEEQGVIGQFSSIEVGFYGAMFSPCGFSVVAHGYHGCLYCWTLTKNCWKSTFMPTGHFSSVEDLSWDPNGLYLLTCSIDKTSRLFAEWNIDSSDKMFCEIARPQIHGYEIQCLSFVTSETFVCGAAEKVLRVFMAPQNFVLSLFEHTDISAETVEQLFHGNASSATVAALGLTNRPVYGGSMALDNASMTTKENEVQLEDSRVPGEAATAGPPDNEYLSQKTLWPEAQKLYGHGFEIFSVASNHAGTVLASACKASRPEHAVVVLWSLEEGVPKKELSGHRLTVTRMAFSPNDLFLLTVSRDRNWCLFCKQAGEFDYTMAFVHSETKCSHTRVIWDCAWAPCGERFFTVSRDKRAIAWQFALNDSEEPKIEVVGTSAMLFDEAVTAVDVLPCQLTSTNLLALGFETGGIHLLLWSPTTDFHILTSICQSVAHGLAVKRLKFRPCLEKDKSGDPVKAQFASCSADGSVKVYDVAFS